MIALLSSALTNNILLNHFAFYIKLSINKCLVMLLNVSLIFKKFAFSVPVLVQTQVPLFWIARWKQRSLLSFSSFVAKILLFDAERMQDTAGRVYVTGNHMKHFFFIDCTHLIKTLWMGCSGQSLWSGSTRSSCKSLLHCVKWCTEEQDQKRSLHRFRSLLEWVFSIVSIISPPPQTKQT